MCCGNEESEVTQIRFIGRHWIGNRISQYPKKIAEELKKSGLWVDVEEYVFRQPEEHISDEHTNIVVPEPTQESEHKEPEQNSEPVANENLPQ